MAKLPAIPEQPLSLELLEQKPNKAFSSRILSRLSKNPLFRPKRGKDGIVSDHEMLTVAATLISAADDRIEELEARSSLLNGPMFAAAKAATADNEEGPSDESNWFSGI